MRRGIFLLAYIALTTAATLYVATSGGVDVGNCQSSPCKTIGYAAVNASSSGDTISIAAGTYSTAGNCLNVNVFSKSLTITSPTGANGRPVTIVDCTGTGWFFRLPGTTVAVSNLIFRNSISALTFDNVTSGSVDNCFFDGSLRGVTFQDSTGTITNSLFERASDSSICSLGTNTGVISVSNCVFRDGNGGGTCYAGGIYSIYGSLNITNNKFIRNDIAIRKTQTGGSLIISGNSFYANGLGPLASTVANAQSSILCSPTQGTSGTLTWPGTNSYCGFYGNYATCGSTTRQTLAAAPADGCGVCWGTNSDKDCTGTCFGNPTSCPTIRSWYVSPTGSDSNTGNSTHPFATIQKGIDMATYGDSVVLRTGTFSGTGNYGINFKGKGVRVRSTFLQPERVNITCPGGATFAFQFETGYRESWDSIIEGVTIRNCQTGITAVNESSPTILNVRFYNNGVGSTLGGGIRLWNSYALIDNCHFQDNFAGDGSGVGIASGSSDPERAHQSMVTIQNSRFKANTVSTTTSSGSAIKLESFQTVTVRNNFFMENQYAIFTRAENGRPASILLIGNSFYNNSVGSVIGCSSGGAGQVNYVNNTGNTFCGYNEAINTDIATGCINFGTPTWLGSSYDSCQVCGGNNSAMDCGGECWGSRTNTSGGCCRPSDRDCAGVCNGTSVLDWRGTCCLPAQKDCSGVCFGGLVNDCLGTCGGTAVRDCNNKCNGTWVVCPSNGLCQALPCPPLI